MVWKRSLSRNSSPQSANNIVNYNVERIGGRRNISSQRIPVKFCKALSGRSRIGVEAKYFQAHNRRKVNGENDDV